MSNSIPVGTDKKYSSEGAICAFPVTAQLAVRVVGSAVVVIFSGPISNKVVSDLSDDGKITYYRNVVK